MEADIMERLVLLVSKFLLGIGLTACSSDHSFVEKNSEELNLRKKEDNSFWKIRDAESQKPDSFNNQF